ncbi:hypothetical protein [uncultured Akkermansia sp.]|uniref:hypothetical protein n=1 Tax=uncultured Akkermansia sp. TaxID=512294 RepID=UPI0025FFEE0C|nr:hypothetical protein [uncultured Akkermansia sp.]
MKLQDNKTAFKGMAFRARSIFETKRSLLPHEQKRAGNYFQVENGSGKTDGTVVFAVGFHMPGIHQVIYNSVVQGVEPVNMA